jgi:hypothetical protein
MLWSWDSLSSSFRIAKLTFFGNKITQSQYHRYLLLVLTDTAPKRRLRVFRIVALVLGL